MNPDQVDPIIESIYHWLDLSGVLIMGTIGGTIARQRGYDIVGFLFIAMVSALGGGMLRDVLINEGTVAAMSEPAYLILAFTGALIGREPAVFGNNQPTVVPAIAGAVVTLIGANTGHLALGAVAGPLTSFTMSMIAYYRAWRVPTSPQFAPVNTTASQRADVAKRGVHKLEPERVRDWRHATLSRVLARELSDSANSPGTREDAEVRVAASTGGKGFGFDKDGTSYADSTNDDSAPAVDQKDVQKGLVELILSDPELADMLARHLAERDGKQKREPR